MVTSRVMVQRIQDDEMMSNTSLEQSTNVSLCVWQEGEDRHKQDTFIPAGDRGGYRRLADVDL